MKYRVKRETRYPVAERSARETRERALFGKKGGQYSLITGLNTNPCLLSAVTRDNYNSC